MSTSELKEQFKEEERSMTLVQIHELIHEMEKKLDPESSQEAKFQLASLYTKSRTPKYIHKGIKYFQDILSSKSLDLEVQRDCLYFISRAYYSLEEYVEARKWINHLIEIDPTHSQAQRLKTLLDEIVYNDGLLGMTAVGVIGLSTISGLAAVGVLAGYFLLRKR